MVRGCPDAPPHRLAGPALCRPGAGGGGGGARSRSRTAGGGGRADLRLAVTGRVADSAGH